MLLGTGCQGAPSLRARKTPPHSPVPKAQAPSSAKAAAPLPQAPKGWICEGGVCRPPPLLPGLETEAEDGPQIRPLRIEWPEPAPEVKPEASVPPPLGEPQEMAPVPEPPAAARQPGPQPDTPYAPPSPAEVVMACGTTLLLLLGAWVGWVGAED